MRTAIIGSRHLTVTDFSPYLPVETTELVSGGAKGIDQCAKNYASQHHLKITEFLPDYARYKKGAPLKRNLQILEYADFVLAFWDGKSRGTKFMITECGKRNIPHKVILLHQ